MKRLLCQLLLGAALALTMTSRVAHAQLDFTGHKALQFFSLIFEKDKWDRTGPAASGEMNYKAKVDDARIIFFGPGGPLFFKSPKDEVAVIEMHTAHLTQPMAKIDQVNINVGHIVLVSGFGLHEKDKWDRTILAQPFWTKYKANANNAVVTIQANVPDRTTIAFKFKAPTDTEVHWCNNVAHIPQDMTPPTDKVKRDSDEGVGWFDDNFLFHLEPWDDGGVDGGMPVGSNTRALFTR